MEQILIEKFYTDETLNAAAVVSIRDRELILEETMYGACSGFLHTRIFKNTDVEKLIRTCSINPEGSAYLAPKKEITLDPEAGKPAFEKCLIMTKKEFRIFAEIAKNGCWLIAFTDM